MPIVQLTIRRGRPLFPGTPRLPRVLTREGEERLILVAARPPPASGLPRPPGQASRSGGYRTSLPKRGGNVEGPQTSASNAP